MTKKNIIFLSVSLVLIILLGIGVSYSMWNISVSQNTNNTAYTKCFDVSISGSKNNIELKNAYPITDDSGKKLIPFSFTITNTCDIFASYTVNLESLKETTLSSKYLKAMLNNEEVKKLSDYEVTDTVNDGSIESYTLAKGSLGSGDSEDYTLRLWIDYATTMADLNNEVKLFKSRIVVKAQPSTWNPVSEGYTTLHDAILANEYQTSPETAIKKIEAKGTPDFSQTAPIITWKIKISNDERSATADTPHPDIIGKAELGTEGLTSENILLKLGTSYTFDSDSGTYNLSNIISADPTTLNLSNGTYYYCNAGSNYDSTNNRVTFWQTLYGCHEILKLISVSKRNYGTPGTSNYRLMYDIVGKVLKQEEVENDKSDTGLYTSEDDYGKAYYYRGNVKNNVVMFAGFYWKIIKINGDNSIRLLYVGTKDDLENITSRAIGFSKFNYNYVDISSVGYMYGKNNSSREEIVKNEIDSNAKSFLDNWYKNNLLEYDSYIANNGFCNDRSIYSGDGYSKNNPTYYGAYSRQTNLSPSYKCPNAQSDLFTTSNSNIGNNALTYPIGILTVDEISFAGYSSEKLNTLNYMYSSEWTWTMTPYVSSGLSSANYSNQGYIGENWVMCNFTVRPVISLKSTTEISGGIGTINDPFVVKTN